MSYNQDGEFLQLIEHRPTLRADVAASLLRALVTTPQSITPLNRTLRLG